jgi:AraC family transcriptional regulator
VKPETRTFYEAAVLRAVERVVRSLDEALDLDALAREAALSAFHFQRVFRGLVGETPLELHRRLRMERAAERLWRTRAGVTAIAFDAGYDTHEAFTRAFGQRYGVSPSGFRERGAQAASACHGGPPTELAARCGLHVRDGRIDPGALTLTTGGISMDVMIETLPVRRLATVRHLGPYPQIAEAFHRLGEIAAERGLYAHVDAPRRPRLGHLRVKFTALAMPRVSGRNHSRRSHDSGRRGRRLCERPPGQGNLPRSTLRLALAPAS